MPFREGEASRDVVGRGRMTMIARAPHLNCKAVMANRSSGVNNQVRILTCCDRSPGSSGGKIAVPVARSVWSACVEAALEYARVSQQIMMMMPSKHTNTFNVELSFPPSVYT